MFTYTCFLINLFDELKYVSEKYTILEETTIALQYNWAVWCYNLDSNHMLPSFLFYIIAPLVLIMLVNRIGTENVFGVIGNCFARLLYTRCSVQGPFQSVLLFLVYLYKLINSSLPWGHVLYAIYHSLDNITNYVIQLSIVKVFSCKFFVCKICMKAVPTDPLTWIIFTFFFCDPFYRLSTQPLLWCLVKGVTSL